MRKALLGLTVIVATLVAVDLWAVDDSRLQAAADTFTESYQQTRDDIEAGEMEHQQQAREAREFREAGGLEWTADDERQARQEQREEQQEERLQELLASLPDDPEAAVVEQINASRAEAGVAPLAAHPQAREVAAAWSRHMAEVDEMYHNPDLVSQLLQRVSGMAGAGENVGYSYDSLESMHESFMNSPGHRANILRDVFTHVGVGVHVDEDTGAMWVTHNFLVVR